MGRRALEKGRLARLSGGADDSSGEGGADGSGEDGGAAFEIVVLEYAEAVPRPSLARLEQNGVFTFISFAYYADEVIETWFSAEGAFLGVWRLSYQPENPLRWTRLVFSSGEGEQSASCFYDSFGSVTELAAGRGVWTAVNDEWGPRYLTARLLEELAVEADADGGMEAEAALERITRLDIQKDERALPVAALVFDGEREYVVEYRYRFDARGNWTEREELRYEEKSGLLIPTRRALTRRTLDY